MRVHANIDTIVAQTDEKVKFYTVFDTHAVHQFS